MSGQSGAFAKTDKRAEIIWAKNLGQLTKYKFALQAGPVLVEGPNQSRKFKKNDYDRLNRAAVCARGTIIKFVVLEGAGGVGLSLYEFAQLLATPELDGGLGCEIAEAVAFDASQRFL